MVVGPINILQPVREDKRRRDATADEKKNTVLCTTGLVRERLCGEPKKQIHKHPEQKENPGECGSLNEPDPVPIHFIPSLQVQIKPFSFRFLQQTGPQQHFRREHIGDLQFLPLFCVQRKHSIGIKEYAQHPFTPVTEHFYNDSNDADNYYCDHGPPGNLIRIEFGG
jgi:hypothetical protein